MSAKPGLPPAWPRRRRVAGFARGSASGGTVPIPVRTGARAELHRELVRRLRALPGVAVTLADDGNGTTFTLDSRAGDAGCTDDPGTTMAWLADVTRSAGIRVRLPVTTGDALRRLGWVAEIVGEIARVRGPRTAAECDVAWRILLCAYEFAACPPGGDDARPVRAERAGCLVPPLMETETAAAI